MTEKLAQDIAHEIAVKEAWSPRTVYWNTIGTVGGFLTGLVSVLLFLYAVIFSK